MNSLESGSNVQSGLEMIMEKSPDTIVLVDRNLTLVKVISAKDDYYHYLANNWAHPINQGENSLIL